MTEALNTKVKDKAFIPFDFRLEEDVAAAYHQMEFSNDCLFLTGRAGTGKSSLLNYFRQHTRKKFVVLAPTGLAALQVGGSTIHSFFGFPLRTMLRNDPDIRIWGKGHPKQKIVKKMDTLIIDEVSMVRADILDAIDQSLRLNTGVEAPFGGKQIILIGDIFQLPPVITGNDHPNHDPDDDYLSPYFFNAQAFRLCLPKIFELTKIYRQHDDNFIFLLNRIRMGIASTDDLNELNKRFDPDSTPAAPFAITLSSVNAIADTVNLKKLTGLSAASFSFKAKVDGDFNERLYPASHVLALKEGAQVMMIKNDLHGRWVNGSIGIVEALSSDEISIRFPDGVVHKVERVTWENKSYHWDKATNTINFVVHGTFTQYPIRLAWAITIHKSQGLTFDKIIIDIGKGAFAHGQLYVALSRARTLEGISLRTRLQPKDVIVDEAVERFAGRYKIQ